LLHSSNESIDTGGNCCVDVQSLCDWDANDGGSLLNAISELLVVYKHYQSSLLKESRLEFDYSLLLEECSLDDVEVYIAGRNAVSSLCLIFANDSCLYHSVRSICLCATKKT